VDIAKPLTNGMELPADLSALSQENSATSPSATGQNRTFPDMTCTTAGSSTSANAAEVANRAETPAVTNGPGVARAAFAVGCPCDAEGESVHPSGIASVSNGKNGSTPESAPLANPDLSASAHGQPTAMAARATPAPTVPDSPPSSHVQSQLAQNADISGQNRTFFPDAKGLGVSEQQVVPASYQPPAGKWCPRTPEEFSKVVRELEVMLREARESGDSKAVRELEIIFEEMLKRRAAATDVRKRVELNGQSAADAA
jgi:hypothetical protein